MMLLRASAGAPRDPGDPSHPHVRLSVGGARSWHDVERIADHLERGDCVHVTLSVPHTGRLSLARRRGAPEAGDGVRDHLADLADLAAIAGRDARHVFVTIEHEPGAMSRWWDAWAWRRGVGGRGRAPARERRLDELLAPAEPYADPAGPCQGVPHLRAVPTEPLPWDVIDELHRCVSAGREAHLVLTPPRSPVSRDPDLHVLWERRMALDVADRVREVAELWPGTSLVRIEVGSTGSAVDRGRRGRGWARRPRRRPVGRAGAPVRYSTADAP